MSRDGFHRRPLRRSAGCVVFTLFVATSAQAWGEIIDASANGMTVREVAHVSAPRDKVYEALIQPQHWWSPKHTFSGDSANLSLDPKAGGCWCESLPNGGSVLHMTVVDVEPGKILRLRGAMGPFQSMGDETVLGWSLASSGDGTDVMLDYANVGYSKEGMDKLAPVVDRVFGEQIQRLKSYIETGAP